MVKYVVNALNKGINNPEDKKRHLEGKKSITLYRHEYFTSYNLDFLIKNKGKSIRLSGYTTCDRTFFEQYVIKKYEEEEVESNNESVFLEIYLEKQEYLPMGISKSKLTGKDADLDGIQDWILPHGIILHVEDFYQEEREYEGRKINFVILSNKIDMKEIILTDKEKARESINKIVKEKI